MLDKDLERVMLFVLTLFQLVYFSQLLQCLEITTPSSFRLVLFVSHCGSAVISLTSLRMR